MEWIADPTLWVGFVTLVVLEVVLGVDNLLFLAILSDKLPPKQRDRARLIEQYCAKGHAFSALHALGVRVPRQLVAHLDA